MCNFSKQLYPNVFPELLTYTQNGSALVIRNTFIEFQSRREEPSSRFRAKSCPAAAAFVNAAAAEPPLMNSQPVKTGFLHEQLLGQRAAVCRGNQCLENDSIGRRGRSYTSPSGATSTTSAGSSRSGDSPCSRAHFCAEDDRTTVILRNLPEDYTRDALLETLRREGFGLLVDFLYLPMNFGTFSTFGYAFINFATSEDAQRFMVEFQGFDRWLTSSASEALVEWSGERQGLQGQIERYRNSGMMHKSVVDVAKPIMLKNGVRVEFPPPTQNVKPLRVRAWKRTQAMCIDMDGEASVIHGAAFKKL